MKPLKLIVLLSTVTLLSACGKKSDNKTSVTRNTGNGGVEALSDQNGSCQIAADLNTDRLAYCTEVASKIEQCGRVMQQAFDSNQCDPTTISSSDVNTNDNDVADRPNTPVAFPPTASAPITVQTGDEDSTDVASDSSKVSSIRVQSTNRNRQTSVTTQATRVSTPSTSAPSQPAIRIVDATQAAQTVSTQPATRQPVIRIVDGTQRTQPTSQVQPTVQQPQQQVVQSQVPSTQRRTDIDRPSTAQVNVVNNPPQATPRIEVAPVAIDPVVTQPVATQETPAATSGPEQRAPRTYDGQNVGVAPQESSAPVIRDENGNIIQSVSNPVVQPLPGQVVTQVTPQSVVPTQASENVIRDENGNPIQSVSNPVVQPLPGQVVTQVTPQSVVPTQASENVIRDENGNPIQSVSNPVVQPIGEIRERTDDQVTRADATAAQVREEADRGTQITVRVDHPVQVVDSAKANDVNVIETIGAIVPVERVTLPDTRLDVYDVAVSSSTERNTGITRPNRNRVQSAAATEVATAATPVTPASSTSQLNQQSAFAFDKGQACTYLDVTHWAVNRVAYDKNPQDHDKYNLNNGTYSNRISEWAAHVCELRAKESQVWNQTLQDGSWTDQIKSNDISSCANELFAYADSCKASVRVGDLTSRVIKD